MFNSKIKNAPFNLDTYGTRGKRTSDLHKVDIIYAKKWFSDFAVIAFLFGDFFCLKVVWNLVQTESPLFVYCVAFACAAALDIPLAIGAIILKSYLQGLSSKKEKNLILIVSIAVFAVAFAASFGFRLVTRELSFDIGTTSAFTNTMSVTSEAEAENPAIFYAALFNGVIPLLTSLSSFVISFFGYDPLGIKLLKVEKERVALQANIIEAEKALGEAEHSEEYCKALIAREKDLFQSFIKLVDAEILGIKQLVRVLLMEKLSTPEGVTAMSKASEKLAEKNEILSEPGEELPEYIDNSLKGEKNVLPVVNSHIA